MNEKYDEKGNIIYQEDSNSWWEKYKHDERGNCIYTEDLVCDRWVKYKHDQNNKCIYIEWSNGEINYPYGKQYYKQYIRREKLKRILNKN